MESSRYAKRVSFKAWSSLPSDPVTAAYILKRVNSPMYGLRRKTSQIERAVNLLGFSEVCNLVISAGMKKISYYQKDTKEIVIYDHIMKDSVTAAAYSRLLADYLNLPLKEMADELGIRAEAVRSRIRRALSKLKPELEAQGIDDADRPVRVLQSTFR